MSKVKLVEEAIKLQAEIKKSEARVKEIKAKLAEDLAPGRSYPIAGVDVQVKNGSKTFKPALFEKKYPQDQRTNLKFYKRTVDRKEVDKRFSQVELDQFFEVGSPSVVIPARKEV